MRSYIKLDASFFRHPKAVAAGRDGRDLFIAGLCYAGDLLTDGFIPAGSVPLLCVECGVKNSKSASSALVAVGLWEAVDGGFQAHDYEDYNSSATTVRAKREAAKDRMQRLRSQDVRANNERSSPDVREQEKEKEKERSYEPNGSSERVSFADSTTTGGKAKRLKSVKTPVPDDLVEVIPPDVWRAIAGEQRLTDEQLRFETAAMTDHYAKKAERMADWVAAWRSWMRSPYRQSQPVDEVPATRLPDGVGREQLAELRQRKERGWSLNEAQEAILAAVDGIAS